MDDLARVRELLGREPRGAFEVVVRDDRGDPVVIRNAPLLDDGTPMPTRYWLVGVEAARAVGRLESAGGVEAAQAAVDDGELAAAHRRYADERDAEIPDDHTGPRPSGGVGGTRTGVKCLHAHYAWHLAGGDDPVGRWVADELARVGAVRVEFSLDGIVVSRGQGWSTALPFGLTQLFDQQLAGTDPPTPEQLSNAVGIVEDQFDEVRRAHPEVIGAEHVRCAGQPATVIGQVEIGSTEVPDEMILHREAAEDVFRTVVTEARSDRAYNPGLPPDHVDTVMAAACVMVALMRRFHLDTVVIERGR
jgi:uncharacterized protein